MPSKQNIDEPVTTTGRTLMLQSMPTIEMMEKLAIWQQMHYSVIKDQSTTGTVKYKYASEHQINQAIADLKAEGFSHSFSSRIVKIGDSDKNEPNIHILTLSLVHASSGGVLQSELAIREFEPNNNRQSKHQQQGSAISYAKRYLLPALLGIAVGGDEGEGVDEPIQQQNYNNNGNRRNNYPKKPAQPLEAENLGRTRQNEVPQTKVEPVLNNKNSKDVPDPETAMRLSKEAQTAFETNKFNQHRDALLSEVSTICQDKSHQAKYADFKEHIRSNTNITEHPLDKVFFTTFEHLDAIEQWLIKNNTSLTTYAA